VRKKDKPARRDGRLEASSLTSAINTASASKSQQPSASPHPTDRGAGAARIDARASADRALFAPLPEIEGGWRCVAADPSWWFRSNSKANPGRNAMRHYDCLSLEEITSLPLREVVAKDALLWLWVPGPFLAVGAHVAVMRAWGFEPTAIGLTWVKQNRNAPELFIHRDDLFMGPGLTTRKNCEFLIIGKRGRPERLATDVHEVVLARVREHSRKPDEAYSRIERYCAGPRLELFARESRPGWTPWGDEAAKFDQLKAAAILCREMEPAR
jgi:N6-adenosine-specific RNA methylase IME4